MDLIITDVTEMGQGTYCVAGWDAVSQRMVRPLPSGNNWSGDLVAKHGICSGRFIQVRPARGSTGAYPHRTEDTPVDSDSITSGQLFTDWLGARAPVAAVDLATGFSGNLKWNSVWDGVRQGVHTLPSVKASSLIAVRIPKANIVFEESFKKLKATLDDGSNKYLLSVSSKVLKEAWRDGGLAAVDNILPRRNEVHVRIGLARPRAGSDCLNRFSASLSGASAGFKLPSGVAAW